jgi:putative methionine-R-sulfoxide reductase with GAF domain
MRESKRGAVESRMVHLAALIRDHREEILDRWLQAVRVTPRVQTLTTSAVVDEIPDLLADIAAFADDAARHGVTTVPALEAAAHARHRFEAGFDLEDVAREYGELRLAILQLVDTGERSLHPGELALLNRAIDHALGRAVSAYTDAHQRIVRALDRVSEATLSITHPDEMLSRLLDVFVDVVAAPVDTVMLLLRDGDTLRVRASVGHDHHASASAVRIGEGFAGRIAHERRALIVDDVQHDPLTSDDWSGAGLQVLYGVPLLHGDTLIGVALMGSHTAAGFSVEQQVLFRAYAARATMIVARAVSIARERGASITSRAFAASATLEEGATRLLAGIGTAFGWDTAIYWRLVPERGVLGYHDRWTAAGVQFPGFHAASQGIVFGPGEGLPGRAWQSGSVEWIRDLGEDGNLPRLTTALDEGLRTAMALPSRPATRSSA